MDRDARQDIGVMKWGSNPRSTLQYCTGFGKTRCAIKIATKLINKFGKQRIIVIVPTIYLKKQWEQILNKNNIEGNVYVINGIVINPDIKKDYECDLVIFDEVHLMLHGNLFKTVFDFIKSKYALALSGTLDEEDNEILSQTLPIIDIITIEEARRNGWVSDFIEYNLLIDMNEEDRNQYDEISSLYDSSFQWFNRDYDTARGCMIPINRLDKQTKRVLIGASEYAKNNPIHGKSHTEATSFYIQQANIFNEITRKRQYFLGTCISKLAVVKDIIKEFNMRTLTFGEHIESANTLELLSGGYAYHSSILGKEVPVIQFDNNGEPIIDMFNTYKTKVQKLGKDKLKAWIIEQFVLNIIKQIHTAKALNLGADIPNVEMGIEYQGYGNPHVHNQRLGRTVRKELDKFAIFVNVVCRNTQDEVWLKARQKNSRRVIPVYSIEEMKKDYEKRATKSDSENYLF